MKAKIKANRVSPIRNFLLINCGFGVCMRQFIVHFHGSLHSIDTIVTCLLNR